MLKMFGQWQQWPHMQDFVQGQQQFIGQNQVGMATAGMYPPVMMYGCYPTSMQHWDATSSGAWSQGYGYPVHPSVSTEISKETYETKNNSMNNELVPKSEEEVERMNNLASQAQQWSVQNQMWQQQPVWSQWSSSVQSTNTWFTGQPATGPPIQCEPNSDSVANWSGHTHPPEGFVAPGHFTEDFRRQSDCFGQASFSGREPQTDLQPNIAANPMRSFQPPEVMPPRGAFSGEEKLQGHDYPDGRGPLRGLHPLRNDMGNVKNCFVEHDQYTPRTYEKDENFRNRPFRGSHSDNRHPEPWDRGLPSGPRGPERGRFGSRVYDERESQMDDSFHPPTVLPANHDGDLVARSQDEINFLKEQQDEFERQFEAWEKQFLKWKEQNQHHPDRSAFSKYEEQWKEWRQQLLKRREQMRRLTKSGVSEGPRDGKNEKPQGQQRKSSEVKKCQGFPSGSGMEMPNNGKEGLSLGKELENQACGVSRQQETESGKVPENRREDSLLGKGSDCQTGGKEFDGSGEKVSQPGRVLGSQQQVTSLENKSANQKDCVQQGSGSELHSSIKRSSDTQIKSHALPVSAAASETDSTQHGNQVEVSRKEAPLLANVLDNPPSNMKQCPMSGKVLQNSGVGLPQNQVFEDLRHQSSLLQVSPKNQREGPVQGRDYDIARPEGLENQTEGLTQLRDIVGSKAQTLQPKWSTENPREGPPQRRDFDESGSQGVPPRWVSENQRGALQGRDFHGSKAQGPIPAWGPENQREGPPQGRDFNEPRPQGAPLRLGPQNRRGLPQGRNFHESRFQVSQPSWEHENQREGPPQGRDFDESRPQGAPPRWGPEIQREGPPQGRDFRGSRSQGLQQKWGSKNLREGPPARLGPESRREDHLVEKDFDGYRLQEPQAIWNSEIQREGPPQGRDFDGSENFCPQPSRGPETQREDHRQVRDFNNGSRFHYPDQRDSPQTGSNFEISRFQGPPLAWDHESQREGPGWDIEGQREMPLDERDFNASKQQRPLKGKNYEKGLRQPVAGSRFGGPQMAKGLDGPRQQQRQLFRNVRDTMQQQDSSCGTVFERHRGLQQRSGLECFGRESSDPSFEENSGREQKQDKSPLVNTREKSNEERWPGRLDEACEQQEFSATAQQRKLLPDHSSRVTSLKEESFLNELQEIQKEQEHIRLDEDHCNSWASGTQNLHRGAFRGRARGRELRGYQRGQSNVAPPSRGQAPTDINSEIEHTSRRGNRGGGRVGHRNTGDKRRISDAPPRDVDDYGKYSHLFDVDPWEAKRRYVSAEEDDPPLVMETIDYGHRPVACNPLDQNGCIESFDYGHGREYRPDPISAPLEVIDYGHGGCSTEPRDHRDWGPSRESLWDGPTSDYVRWEKRNYREEQDLREKHVLEVPKVLTPSVVVACKKGETVSIRDLLYAPGRRKRPPQLVVLLRGPPGSGKSYVAKLIKDKECENGGSAPRMLCLDDYFMVETEKTVKDPETGKRIKTKEFVYDYEAEMEDVYRQSLFKSFKKTIDDKFFPFIIVDAVHSKAHHLQELWTYAKQKSFQVYVAAMECTDPVLCHRRNIHQRSLEDIRKVIEGWEETPVHMSKVDIRSLLQDDAITEVEMEDSSERTQSLSETDCAEKEGEEEMPQEHVPSKWEILESSEDKLDRLDGFYAAKRKHSTFEDFLQLPDDYEQRRSQPGKKRVRWADLEERKNQDRLRAIGFVVGQTDWSKMTDPSHADRALTHTKYI